MLLNMTMVRGIAARLLFHMCNSSLRSVQGAEGEAVKQHVRTALSLVQSLVVDAELEARLKDLQPLKLQTLHDVRASAVADGKSLGQMPLHGLKLRCALPMHPCRMHVLSTLAPA